MNYKEEKKRRDELREKRIKLEDLQDRKLYRLLARNIKIGVWSAELKQFLGIRTKFGSRFIDGEYHWDAPDFATACPTEVLGDIPENISLAFLDVYSKDGGKVLFQFLDAKEKELGLDSAEE